ncbi:hypothetical protein K439DRAFT_1347101 [Ramaria rubella]|nr:hypothetical protein K439DRAFT_1347101 [Ramaria rubella]
MTPFKIRYQMKANLTDLPEWGTKVFVLKKGRGKLDAKADEGRWMGYSSDMKGHCIYWPGKCHITVECNLTFESGMTTVPIETGIEGV